MGKLKLTLACDKYDYLQQLREREIQPEGIDLNLITVESGPRHQRMYQYGEYDACEFSLSSYLVAKSQGVSWFQAIPFFPRRMFSHKFCLVRSASGIRMPSDLRGARIGLRSYENTLALATKGMFHNTYGLSVTDVTWVVINKEPVGSKLPPAIKVEQAERTCKLEDLLLLGKIDAQVEPDIPQSLIRGDDKIARLFPNFENDEREHYSQTKIFPIMHLIVIKTEILKNAPWVAMSLFEAFMACRRAYDEFMQQPHRLSFAWGRSYLEEEKKFFKKSPFYQGLKENYNDIQNMIMFAQQQGMLAKPLTVDDLFIENTRAT